jgi:hypothetical protein
MLKGLPLTLERSPLTLTLSPAYRGEGIIWRRDNWLENLLDVEMNL